MFIRLSGIRIFAHHGVYEDEIANGNLFEIDLETEISDSQVLMNDTLSDTIDYSELYSIVNEVSNGQRYNLIEAFASDICSRILDSFPTAESITVKVRKMNPPLRGEVNFAEVELTKKRSNA